MEQAFLLCPEEISMTKEMENIIKKQGIYLSFKKSHKENIKIILDVLLINDTNNEILDIINKYPSFNSTLGQKNYFVLAVLVLREILLVKNIIRGNKQLTKIPKKIVEKIKENQDMLKHVSIEFFSHLKNKIKISITNKICKKSDWSKALRLFKNISPDDVHENTIEEFLILTGSIKEKNEINKLFLPTTQLIDSLHAPSGNGAKTGDLL